MKNILLIISLYLLLSCSNTKENTFVVKINPSESQRISIDSISKTQSCTILDDSIHMVGEVKKMLKHKSYAYFLEENEHPIVSCFDLITGAFLFKIDKFGRGPSEYADIEDILIDENNGSLLLYERTNQRILSFDLLNGNYISEQKVGMYFTQFCMDNKGNFLLWRDEGDYRLQLYSNTFKNCLASVCMQKDEALDMPRRLCLKEDVILFSKIFDDNIYKFKNKKVTTFCKVDFVNHSLPEDIINIADDEEKMSKIFNGNFALGICNIFACESSLLFSYSFNQKLNTVILTKDKHVINCSELSSNKYDFVLDYVSCSDGKHLFGLVYLDEEKVLLNTGQKTNSNPIILTFDIDKL
jgi:hypothetical protein